MSRRKQQQTESIDLYPELSYEDVKRILYQQLKEFDEYDLAMYTEQALVLNQLCVVTNVSEENRYNYMCEQIKESSERDYTQKKIDDIIGWADLIRQYPNAPNCGMGWQKLTVDIGISAKNNLALEALARLPPEIQHQWKTPGYCEPVAKKTECIAYRWMFR